MAENGKTKQVEANTALHTPARDDLPQIGWLRVADLLVDYSYQHRPYAKAIEELHKNFQVDYSGFILVNRRSDGTHWVIDGQTRREVHLLRGLPWIRAEILTGLTQEGEAHVYLLKCINAKRMPVDFFLAEYIARQPQAVLIHDILDKRGIGIESFATTQRRRGSDAQPVVTCVSYLKRMLVRDATGDVLGMALDLIGDTWGYNARTLAGLFLDAIHKIIFVHGDELDRKTFITKLGGYLPEELRDQAMLLRLGTKPQLAVGVALQRVIIDSYNSGRASVRRIELGSPHRG